MVKKLAEKILSLTLVSSLSLSMAACGSSSAATNLFLQKYFIQGQVDSAIKS